MNFINFQKKARFYPIFKLADIFKWFPGDKRGTILNQINLWSKKGYLEQLTRGIYRLSDSEIKEPFILANFLCGQSYISLESALNVYGIIPDVPFAVTSITISKTKTVRTKNHGVFFYRHIKPELFFGFNIITADAGYVYRIAKPEKALFDFIYFYTRKAVANPQNFIEELRLRIPEKFDFNEFKKWAGLIDQKQKNFHASLKVIMKKYGD